MTDWMEPLSARSVWNDMNESLRLELLKSIFVGLTPELCQQAVALDWDALKDIPYSYALNIDPTLCEQGSRKSKKSLALQNTTLQLALVRYLLAVKIDAKL